MTGKLKIIRTDDGSPSIYNAELDESYHSAFGALRESMHVYIQEGFNKITGKDSLNILEIGFGTGLNALLTAIEASKKGIQVWYTSLEPYPISQDIWQELNFDLNHQELFSAIHLAPWEQGYIPLTPHFNLLKVQKGILAYDRVHNFDLIYFDAFAPSKQPEMWEISIFQKLDACVLDGSLLVTYSATGAFRRILKSLGWTIEKVPGPPGKREMTRAMKRTDSQ